MNHTMPTAPVANVPAWAKPFVGRTAAQFLEKYIPLPKLEAMAGAIFGLIDLGVEIPEWAKNASRQFWKHYIGDRPLCPKESVEDFGVLVVMVENFMRGSFAQPQPMRPPSKLEKILSGITKRFYSLLMQEIVSKLSHEEKRHFHIGCARGEEMMQKMQNPSYLTMVKRARVYLSIAVAWRQFEQFPSHAAAERWLRSQKIIGDEETFSSRDVYAVFEIIKLPGAKPGRPKKSET